MHTVSCANNEKQITLALFNYASDYNGRLPLPLPLWSAGRQLYFYNRPAIQGGIADYLPDVENSAYFLTGARFNWAPPVSICPEGGRDGEKSPTTNKPDGNTYPNFSYATNEWLDGTAANDNRSRSYSSIYRTTCPSETALLLECGIDGWNCLTIQGAYIGETSRIAFRHVGRAANIVFADGHIEAKKLTDVPAGSDGHFWRGDL
jgi:prepilin-type processing-associated H-X9-DG protein